MGKNFATLYGYQPAALIKITGEDAFSFLQGQFTNDLRPPPGCVTYGLWLNQKGKVIADSQLLRFEENRFLLFSSTSVASIIQQRLEQYIIADDVTLWDETGNTQGVALWGEQCAELLKGWIGVMPPPFGRFLQHDGILIFSGRRSSEDSYEIIGPGKLLTEMGKQFVAQGCLQATAPVAELARISSGIPAIPQDIGQADLPNEAGLEIPAISYTKGCYLGQEVMARLKNLGQVRRHLRGVRGTGEVPKTGTPLFQGDRRAGEIRSAVATEEGFIALAMLTRIGLDEKLGFSYESASSLAQHATVWMR